ncbi:Spo0E family sporulation regulatory protein-aspartic acid phosphatase [Neobacillus sp.]|jgi:Spo0E like sporulation regulatory protein|uniref:Spo0E family sporulation regulatory protein-aspartic acid phosphatase n=1 Tax=Neobacillus sp. TaxID=2675273 RepID=UPI0035B51E7A
MKESIISSIELARKKMIESIRDNGINSETTILLSEKLDSLINQYQSNNTSSRLEK